MLKSKYLLLINLLVFIIITCKHIEYKEEGTIGILKITYPMINSLNSKGLDEIEDILNKINTNLIKALIIDAVFDISKLSSVDEEPQKLMDEYIQYGKDTNQNIQVIPFPSINPVSGFLVLLNDEIVKSVITGESEFDRAPGMEEMVKMTKIEAEKFSQKGNNVLRKIETFPIPVIFLGSSSYIGTGLQIALSCDIRIGSDKMSFGLPEVSYGIMPGFGGTQRLARIIGSGFAKQMIFTGECLEAKEALKYGLVSATYPTDTLWYEAKKIAENLGKNSLSAIKNSKKAMNDGLNENIDKALIIEEKLFGDCFETQDQKVRMEIFLDKNKKNN